ncbi:MAG: UbiX family flavin prenyltransferase [Bacteroidales bacterium]|nr:UbiX family flavin prenyltransferase [Bacteroidales bacterium]
MKIIVAVTGASGAIYAQLLFDKLHELHCQIDEVCVVFSMTAKEVWKYEMQSAPNLYNFKQFNDDDFFSPIASGSAQYDAMVICPCSAGTMGRIAHGTADTLITRAADVMLKERRKLILAFREMPYSLIHIKNMELITLAGGIICPASPSFYAQQNTINEVCNSVTDRIIDLIGLSNNCYRWGE